MVPISSSITLFLIITPQLLIFSVVCADIEVVIMWYICKCLKIKKSKIDVRGEGHGKHLMDVILELKTSK